MQCENCNMYSFLKYDNHCCLCNSFYSKYDIHCCKCNINYTKWCNHCCNCHTIYNPNFNTIYCLTCYTKYINNEDTTNVCIVCNLLLCKVFLCNL